MKSKSEITKKVAGSKGTNVKMSKVSPKGLKSLPRFTKNTADVNTMFCQLKSDLVNGIGVSYSGNEINMRVNRELVTWELKGKKLWRYCSFVWTVSSEVVYSFKYQGVFVGYMAFEIVGKEGPMFGMVQVR